MLSSSYIAANVLCLVLFLADHGDAFLPPPPRAQGFFHRVGPAYSWGSRRSTVARRCSYSFPLCMRSWYGDDREEEDDDDDDEMIDPDSLGDWRAFRRNLAVSSTDPEKTKKTPSKQSVSRQNEELLKSQNEELAKEYTTGVWAHEVSTVRFSFSRSRESPSTRLVSHFYLSFTKAGGWWYGCSITLGS